ncbi:transmembrane protein 268 isoform X3 [Cynoglossus semilaevis]|nr:transmembrane protein 268 isoform X3 [Cynoglossus semilaevis]
MQDKDRVCPVEEEKKWSNGQCVLSLSSCSAFNPTFDLSVSRTVLEDEGFQIPVTDMEVPLRTALDVPSVRRYMVFNSAYFHFLMAPVLYVVLWCGVFSTLHLYIPVSDYWVLCLYVSLVSILLTTAIIFILNRSNKEISMNLDVRLIQVNERLVKHKLLVGVSDWVQNCTGKIQLVFVYWDISRCLRTLTEELEERSFVVNETQKKLKKKMSNLTLVAEVTASDPEAGISDAEQPDLEEHRPLLEREVTAGSSSSGQQAGAKVPVSYSLVPDASLPVQTQAFQLLMTYSAAYVKLLASKRLSHWLLASKRLSDTSHYGLRSSRGHCSFAPLCLCQYIKKKILQ